MKELIVSNCEKAFVLNAINEGIRLDGRKLDESRQLKICFGSEWGSCHVSLGNTKVTSHISYKIEQPKQSKPNEGILFINVDVGSMGAPNFDNRPSDLNVTLNRLVEKCIIDSRCVDLESLCIVSEEKVWCLRVDIHILNHAGNLIECASVAALSSLAHFKRPDITTNGEEIIVHTLSEKDPIPTVLHHYPVCVLFGFFSEEIMIADPNLLEETICSSVGALFTIGMNSYREVCLFDLAGAAITLGTTPIYKASQRAAERAKELVTCIKDALKDDESARSNNERIGFPNAIPTDKLTTLSYEKLCLRLKNFTMDESEPIGEIQGCAEKENDSTKMEEENIITADNDVGGLLPTKADDSKKPDLWTAMESASEDDDVDTDQKEKNSKEDNDIEIIETKPKEPITLSSGSEEDDVVILKSENTTPQKGKKKKNTKKRI